MDLHEHRAVTLIELMVVIIIIGVVLAFGIPMYQNVVQKAREKTVKNCLLLIKDAQEIYLDDNSHYFPDAGGIPMPGLTNINNNLNLAIIGDFAYYSCTSSAWNLYSCTGTYPQPPASAQWCCKVTESASPVCYTGACP